MSDPPASLASRRPLKVRQRQWAIRTAAMLAARRVPPRFISVLSLVTSAAGSMAFVSTVLFHSPIIQSLLFLIAVAMMQLRLVCNLLDGMVAVEGKMGTPDGELYNDLPDRFSDWMLFLAIGYAARFPGELIGGMSLGWSAAMLAVLTAYVRVLGKACKADMHFAGPMAKQQRMAVMTVASLGCAILTPWGLQARVLWIALIVVILGSIWTIVRRLILIRDDLQRAAT